MSIPLEGKEYLFCNGLTFSLDGRRLIVACSDGTLRVWDMVHACWLQTLDGGKRSTPIGFMAALAAVAYDPLGILLAARGEGKLIFWDARGQLVRRVNLTYDARPDHSAVQFSPDGRYLVSSEGDDLATLWEVRSGQVVGHFRGHERPVVGVCFLDGGRQVLSASRDQTLLLWDRALMEGDRPRGEGLEETWKVFGGNAKEAHTAIWQMVRLPGAEAFLAKELTGSLPSKELVRTEQVQRWITDLSAEEAPVRDTARRQLLANLDYAEGAVLRATNQAASSQGESILDQLRAHVFKRRQSADRLRVDRALAVLEYLGSKESKAALQSMAAGKSEHWLKQDAKAALQRLSKDVASNR